MVVPLIIIISYAIIRLSSKIKPIHLLLVSIILLVYSFFKLYTSIFILNEYQRARYWDYGWEQVAETIKTLDINLPIIVDNARNEPYIHLLFFLKHDPVEYQRGNFEIPLSEYYTNMTRNKEKHIGRIITREINWKPDLQTEQYFIGDNIALSPGQIVEHNLTLIKEIKYPDDSTAFYIVKTNPRIDL